jgi:DNA-directed RNA polymerase II subunit RPB7
MVEYLENKLMSDVEGTCSGKFGYIICVLTVTDVGAGIVLPGNGQAEFIARYRAIVFKPFKGEVLEGVVGEVNKVCMASVNGPRIDLTFHLQMGFFAEVGPLNVFVSNHVCHFDYLGVMFLISSVAHWDRLQI